MKVIIAGSRTIDSRSVVIDAINNSGFQISEVVSGACPDGVDKIGEDWAKLNELPVKRFPAEWSEHGLSAGPRRNASMAVYADALILVWDGVSRGSRSMKREATKRGLPVYERIV